MKWQFITIGLIIYVVVAFIFMLNNMALHQKDNINVEHNSKSVDYNFMTDHINDIVTPALD